SGETSIYGLYACGETSCTGVHGANRLASNSLLEGLVFGQRIVDEAHSMIYRRNIQLEEILATYDQEDQLHVPTGKRLPQQVRMDLRRIMWENVGIIRDEQSLKKAARMVDELNGELGPGDDELQYYQVLNMLTIAQVMIQAALWRKESRGAHFRRDYPATDNIRWAEHLIFRNW
ncbi:MAG: FAD-binding protein, partial [Syntrophomonadaceae bacterium]|nr:FAD-binding protein [Syntrophomonadaceae bacterium]